MRFIIPAGLAGCLMVLGPAARPAPLWASPLQIIQLLPQRNAAVSAITPITIDFDRAVDPATINSNTFRVFGRWSGTKSGSYTLSNADQSVTFTPSTRFTAGEAVHVNLSHSIMSADSAFLRGAGFAYDLRIQCHPASAQFTKIDQLSNRINNVQTRIYGAAAADLDEDGFLDLTTINEVSADVRVCLNRADGSGLYQPFLTPQPIGNESSPNETADFNNDGHTDLCIAASESDAVTVLLGSGDGTFASTQWITVGNEPHGITTLDVDGDGDRDIVVANVLSDSLALMINDGTGVFGPAVLFNGGVSGERAVAGADMDNDGIADLVVGGTTGNEIRILHGNGDGTFTPASPSHAAGGETWGIVVDDVNGDGNLDVSVSNGFSHSGSVLRGNGAGAFSSLTVIATGFHTPSTDLGDVDGDGDVDLVLSVYSGQFWRLYLNDGTGNFTLSQQFTAPNNPSCAVLYDFDNDGDLDMGLTDEVADVVILMRNGTPTGVEAETQPARLTLLPNAPNPLRSGTVLRFELPVATNARLDVFDVSGRCVRRHDLLARTAGRQDVFFDGLDVHGQPLRNGVYLYRVTAGHEARSGRLVVAR